MGSEHPLIESLRIVQRDLSSVKARVSEIQRQIATLSLGATKAYLCPLCRIPFPSTLKCDEHLYRVHEGPVPAQWREDSTASEVAITLEKPRADTVVPAPSALPPPEGSA